MTTFKEIIYNLKNLRQAGRQSQDALLSDAQYAFIIDYYRSILINREVENKRALSSVLEQTLEVPFIRASNVDVDVFKERKVYLASPLLPSVVHVNNRPLYQAVRKTMFSASISRSTTNSIRYDLNSPTTSHFLRYFPEGMNLYIVTPESLQKMFVTAIFEHPLEVEEWKFNQGLTNNFNPYDPYDFPYPMPLKHIDALYKMMTDGEIKFSMLAPNDIKADGNEEGIKQQASTPKQASSSNES